MTDNMTSKGNTDHGQSDIGADGFADIIAVSGDPIKDITEMERIQFVMKGGFVYKANGKEVIVSLEEK